MSLRSSGFGSPDAGSNAQNNDIPDSYDGLSVSDIKRRAIDSVVTSLIKKARTQTLVARGYEANGDLRRALATYTKAATLANMVMENTGKIGVIQKEVYDFFELEGKDITQRTSVIERNLGAIESAEPRDYAQQSPRPLVQRPPQVAPPPLSEWQDGRSIRSYTTSAINPLPKSPRKPPRIDSDYPVSFWGDMRFRVCALKGTNPGITATVQCLNATVPFARFFTEGRWKTGINYTNPLSSKGIVTKEFAKLLDEISGGNSHEVRLSAFLGDAVIAGALRKFHRANLANAQEFLGFLMDELHEDLNRVLLEPTDTPTLEDEAELDRLPTQMGNEREWRRWKSRNDSLIVDYF